MHFLSFSLFEEHFLLHVELFFHSRYSGWSRSNCDLPSLIEGAYTHCEQLPCDFLEGRCHLWVRCPGAWLLGDMCCKFESCVWRRWNRNYFWRAYVPNMICISFPSHICSSICILLDYTFCFIIDSIFYSWKGIGDNCWSIQTECGESEVHVSIERGCHSIGTEPHGNTIC